MCQKSKTGTQLDYLCGVQQKQSIMANFDFIPTNPIKSALSDENRLELVCKAFMTKHTNVYDGRNHYAPKVGVCKSLNGTYTFESESDAKSKGYEFLFYPSTEEIRKALSIFKDKGYYPFYDREVCYYGYVCDKNQIRGEWTIKKTEWL